MKIPIGSIATWCTKGPNNSTVEMVVNLNASGSGLDKIWKV